MQPMEKQELHRRVGSPSQLYSVRRTTLREGPGKGVDLFEVNTAGGLQLDVLPDTGLDIGQLRYKGINISYISKNEYDTPGRFIPYEMEFLRTFPAGLLYTCGLRSAGPPSRDGDEWHPQHGRYHGLAAANPSAYVEGGDIVIRGVIRESALFGHALQLERVIRIPVYGSEIVVEDTLENLTPRAEEIMLLYHMNFGYPLLSESARLVLPEGRKTTPRTEFAKAGMGAECGFTPPVDGEEEQVYFHDLPSPVATLENPELGIAAQLTWSGDTLPILAQWRSMASGEYVLGLEPSNSFIMGRVPERQNGTLQSIGPFERKRFRVALKLSGVPLS